MKNIRFAKSFAIAAQFVILLAAPGLSRTQSSAPQIAQPAASSQTQENHYADAFAGLTYNDEQKKAISKIKQDIDLRKTAVMKDDKLTSDQKDAMLTGYTRIEYGLIFKALTPGQKKQVSERMKALREADQAAQKAQAPAR